MSRDTKNTIKHFLIIYDRIGTAPDVSVYDDAEEALREYGRAERKIRELKGAKVVLIGAKSLDIVKVTHSNLWKPQTLEDLARDVLLDL